MGRPVKFNDKAQERYLDGLAKGMRRTQAALAAGVTLRCVDYFAVENVEFQKLSNDAEIAACDPLETKLYEMALKGHFPSLKFWLTNRSPNRWSDTKAPTQIFHSDGTPKTAKELQEQLEKLLPPEQPTPPTDPEQTP